MYTSLHNVALDKQSPTNWLDDNFWLKKAYHEWRIPLIINSNWWLAFHNDTGVPEYVVLGQRTALGAGGVTDWQVRRAAWLVRRTLEWKARLERCVFEICSEDEVLTSVLNTSDWMTKLESLGLVSLDISVVLS